MAEGWNNKKQGRYASDVESLEKRARDLRRWLKARPEEEIVLVTHGGFVHWFSEDWVGMDEGACTGWANTEWRTYAFDDDKGEGESDSIAETTESRKRRQGTEMPLTEMERVELERSFSQRKDKKNKEKERQLKEEADKEASSRL